MNVNLQALLRFDTRTNSCSSMNLTSQLDISHHPGIEPVQELNAQMDHCAYDNHDLNSSEYCDYLLLLNEGNYTKRYSMKLLTKNH